MTETELIKAQHKAILATIRGKRLEAMWRRVMVTPLGDLLRGRIWPDEG